MGNTYIKPTVVVSKCLEFSACRYNGELISDQTIRNLKPYVNYKTVCPEVEIGLGVPRDVIRLVGSGEENRLVQPSTNIDLTDKMQEFSEEFIEQLNDVDGFILKGRSPSCGINDAKIYSGASKSPCIGKGSGKFASKVLEKYSNLAIEDEGRLKNFTIREHFLTKLFSIAEFRHVKNLKNMNALNEYHSKNKYLFMGYNQLRLKKLGQALANHEKRNMDDVLEVYEEQLYLLFARAPKYTNNINVSQHIFGYFSKELTTKEKEYFLEMLEKYREKKVPISNVVSLLKAWVYRFENEYLLKQTFFSPYPEELLEISDSGKGRDYS